MRGVGEGVLSRAHDENHNEYYKEATVPLTSMQWLMKIRCTPALAYEAHSHSQTSRSCLARLAEWGVGWLDWASRAEWDGWTGRQGLRAKDMGQAQHMTAYTHI